MHPGNPGGISYIWNLYSVLYRLRTVSGNFQKVLLSILSCKKLHFIHFQTIRSVPGATKAVSRTVSCSMLWYGYCLAHTPGKLAYLIYIVKVSEFKLLNPFSPVICYLILFCWSIYFKYYNTLNKSCWPKLK